MSSVCPCMIDGVQVGRMGYVPAQDNNGDSRNVSCSKPSLHCRKRPWEGALYKWLTRSTFDAMHVAYIYINNDNNHGRTSNDNNNNNMPTQIAYLYVKLNIRFYPHQQRDPTSPSTTGVCTRDSRLRREKRMPNMRRSISSVSADDRCKCFILPRFTLELWSARSMEISLAIDFNQATRFEGWTRRMQSFCRRSLRSRRKC